MMVLIEGEDRRQANLFPERFDDYIIVDSVVRMIDVFIEHVSLPALGVKTEPSDKGQPA